MVAGQANLRSNNWCSPAALLDMALVATAAYLQDYTKED